MKMLALAAITASILAQPVMAETDRSGAMGASFSLGSARVATSTPTASSDALLNRASQTGRFDTLMSAIEAAGVREELGNMGTYTFFAPTDEAFEKLPAGAMERLMQPENRHQLIALLRMHVVAGEALTQERLHGQQMTAETLNGPVAIDGTDPSTGVWVNAVSVSGPDIRGPDGVILAIDTLLLPMS